VAAVLRRQRELGGTIKLPAQSHRIAEGCGFEVYSVAVPERMIDGDDWRSYRGHPLLRVKAGAHLPSVGGGVDWEAGAPWFAVGNTLRQGSRLSAPKTVETAEKPAPTFGALVADLCARRGADRALCATYAAGSQPAPDGNGDRAWRRVRRVVQKDWPAAARRFEELGKALDRGLLLDRGRGETRRQSCQALLVDACSGDIAEVCAVTPDEREAPCPGTRLPDGRCEVVRFARLPTLD
jgi:hypothetical protein